MLCINNFSFFNFNRSVESVKGVMRNIVLDIKEKEGLEKGT